MSNEKEVEEEKQEKPEREPIKRIERAWTKFSGVVLPGNTHPQQLKWMKRAFFAGAEGMLHDFTASLSEVDDSINDRFLEDVKIEMMDFAYDVLNGKA